jgi:hypothetical protein
MERAAPDPRNISDIDAFVNELETRGWSALPPKEYRATYDVGGGEVVTLSPNANSIVLESNRLPPDPWGTVVIDPVSQQVRAFTTMAREGGLQVVYISAPLATFRQVAGPILGDRSALSRPTTQHGTGTFSDKPVRGIG